MMITCQYCGQTNEGTDARGGCLACSAPIDTQNETINDYIGEEFEYEDNRSFPQFIERYFTVDPDSLYYYDFYPTGILRSVDLIVPAIGEDLRIRIIVNHSIMVVDVIADRGQFRFPLGINTNELCSIRIEFNNKSNKQIGVRMIESRIVQLTK